eukprot:g11711.t1
MCRAAQIVDPTSTQSFNLRLREARARGAGWLEALRLLKRLQGQVKADVISFNTVLTACGGGHAQPGN